MGRGCALWWTVASWWPRPARTATPAMAFEQKYKAPFPMWPGAVRLKQPPFLTLWAPRQTAEVGWAPWSGFGLLWWIVSNSKFCWHQKWVVLCAGILCAPARSQIIEDNASMQTSYGCIFQIKTSVATINITLAQELRVIVRITQPGAYTVYAPGWLFFEENGIDLGKPRPQTSDFT